MLLFILLVVLVLIYLQASYEDVKKYFPWLSDSNNATILATSICAFLFIAFIYSFQNNDTRPITLEEDTIIPSTELSIPEPSANEQEHLFDELHLSEEELEDLKSSAKFKDALNLLVSALQSAAKEMTLPADEDLESELISVFRDDESHSEPQPESEHEPNSNEFSASIKDFDYMKKNAEMNWDWFRVSRNYTSTWYELDRFGADYPCFFGTSVIGSEGKHVDGNKWVCGLQYWNAPDCVVFSIGSQKLVHFEEQVRNQNPDCDIYIWDPTVEETDKWNSRMQNWGFEFLYVGIGKEDGEMRFNRYQGERDVKSLVSMMDHVNVDHIDILKMDVEGHEWSFLNTTGFTDALKKVRSQVIIEIHLGSHFKVGKTMRTERLNEFFDIMEDHGFRCFHKEIFFQKKMNLNGRFPKQMGAEISFVHKDWMPKGFESSLLP